MRPSVIVLLPRDPAEALQCLEGLADQPELPEHEVVLVDDDAPALAPLLSRVEGDVEVVRLPARSGRAAALDAGLARAGGEVVAILDGRAVPARGWLAPLVSALGDSAVAGATPAGTRSPAAAPAIAARRADLAALGATPAVDDALVLPAVLLALSARGAVVPVVGSGVAVPGAPPRARGDLDRALEVSIVVPTLDAASDRVRACVRAVQTGTDAAHEIIVLDNGAPPQGYTAPVNAGLRAARGAYLVVLNDDVEVLPGWWPALRAALDAGAPVAFPRTIDAFDRDDFAAWCFAMRRETVDRYGVAPGEFLDPDLRVWFQDTDLLARLRAAGTSPVRVESATVRHTTSTTIATPDPALRAWIQAQSARDRATFQAKHPETRLVQAAVG